MENMMTNGTKLAPAKLFTLPPSRGSRFLDLIDGNPVMTLALIGAVAAALLVVLA